MSNLRKSITPYDSNSSSNYYKNFDLEVNTYLILSAYIAMEIRGVLLLVTAILVTCHQHYFSTDFPYVDTIINVSGPEKLTDGFK